MNSRRQEAAQHQREVAQMTRRTLIACLLLAAWVGIATGFTVGAALVLTAPTLESQP